MPRPLSRQESNWSDAISTRVAKFSPGRPLATGLEPFPNHVFLTHVIVIHRGFPRDGDITEIIPWQYKPNLQIFMCKLCFIKSITVFANLTVHLL